MKKAKQKAEEQTTGFQNNGSMEEETKDYGKAH